VQHAYQSHLRPQSPHQSVGGEGIFYHAWIGVRDIWMDYVKPVGIRLALQVLTVLWLVGCAAYAIQILWKV